jgi:hypothetical protein
MNLGRDKVASQVNVFEYSSDEHGNWVERRESHQFRSDTHTSKNITTRKLTY